MSPAPALILRLDGQRASVGEEGWRTARVEENDVVAWPPPSCPYECDETSKPFARVDRVKREGFEGTRQFDRFDCCVMRDAISRSGVAGDDFHICVIERRLKEVGSGFCVSDNVRSHPFWLSVDVDPNHARAFERDRCANHETGRPALLHCPYNERWPTGGSRKPMTGQRSHLWSKHSQRRRAHSILHRGQNRAAALPGVTARPTPGSRHCDRRSREHRAGGHRTTIVPHMVAAIVGLAALLHASALAFHTLKYVGVAYLLYMAW